MVVNKSLVFSTRGNGQLIDVTAHVNGVLADSGVHNGILTVFVVGSTAAVTTLEYEPGLIKDMAELYDKLAPQNKRYAHDETWGDANGFSHVRAALQGPSLTIPFENSKLYLGTWQQIVLADFDHRPRSRTIVVNIIGE
ncbi:secondary thiamine-phosphate synthase enzyme YjbQ [Candidatus Magnetominusculus xianensis]|uniref:Secondary thiamine-phosphate synthase enzyme n=1 Tax=Candidatus Magnetominusculus xianensis TaxID=1748249 RepID=A0ABR5SE10_9BACT|nr:secondary thiamine-phosphate synthase enzyme YjbQ [Candidatus Magnetominusculus xianensis]KWT84010.1 secondary thiamine-phosphate synthase enzyme [Candidatus Magnetominusculus xianensis]MBF0405386.1 YjbQ family protein [Nitrospirota bacterium]